MVKVFQRHFRIEIARQPRQYIHAKLARDAFTVVISRLNDCRVLAQVDPDEQTAARADQPAAAAHEVSALMQYRGMKLREAAQTTLDTVKKLGGEGGLIAIDRNGDIATPFNTNGMYRGYVDPNGKFVVEIYK